jgi:hypothetical protein
MSGQLAVSQSGMPNKGLRLDQTDVRPTLETAATQDAAVGEAEHQVRVERSAGLVLVGKPVRQATLACQKSPLGEVARV